MTLHYTTPVSNMLFDVFMRELTLGELIVLLVVIRQTAGFIENPYTKKRKQSAWIAGSVFRRKGGISNRTVSKGIQGLIDKKYLIVTDRKGYPLSQPEDRKKSSRLIFRPTIGSLQLGITTEYRRDNLRRDRKKYTASV